jgi:hypothetical protein
LTFTNTTYRSNNLELIFESIAGYAMDDSLTDTYKLRAIKNSVLGYLQTNLK